VGWRPPRGRGDCDVGLSPKRRELRHPALGVHHTLTSQNRASAEIMKTQRLLIVLTVLNLGLLAFLLTQSRLHIGWRGVQVWTNSDESVLRGRALEIIDDEGRTRASIGLHPASQGYPETVILRLVDQNGRPSVKLSTSEQGGLLAVVSDAEGTYVQLSGRELNVTKDGQRHAIP
jgi:hypothetical protein